MDRKTKALGAAGAVAAAAVGVGVAVARRKGAEPSVYHVRPTEDGWALTADHREQPASTHGTKKDALSAGRRLAGANAPSTLVLHYADGREQKRIGYDAD